MAAKLVVQAPGGQRHEFPLSGAAVAIGRGQDADLVLDYDYISRLHAKVERTRDGYMVVDCASTNGTEVNGRRVNGMQMLSSGDEIQLGDITLTFFDTAAADATTAFFRPVSFDSPIRCDSSTWQVWVGNTKFEGRLSLQEFELLSLLTSRYGRVCTREELGTAIWGRGNYDYNLLHRLVHRLKEKLGTEHGGLIVSVPGKGYKIAAVSRPPSDRTVGPVFKTIVFTDIEGSTQLVRELGDEGARKILREVEEITRQALAANGGREVKTMGDGFMASFESATQALTCALQLQNAFAERNARAKFPLTLRIGLNAGEPVEEEEDLFGAAVVTAARLGAEAKGGEVLVTDLVRQLVAGKGFSFADRGEFVPRGLDDPVRIWQVSA